MKAIADRFNASQTRYEAIPLSVPGSDDAKTKFMLSVAGGDPPDLVATWEPVLPVWARDGIVQPLGAFMSPSDRTAYDQEYPVARRAGTYRGKVYGLSVGLNVPGLYYRPSLLKAVGLPDRPPHTLEELARWGARLDERDPDGRIRRVGLDPGWLRDLAPLFGARAEAGRIDSPENLAALRWIVGVKSKLGLKAVQRYQSGIGIGDSGRLAQAGWPFAAGRYAMAVDGQWRVSEVAKGAPEFVDDYRTAPLPPHESGPRGAGYAVATLIAIPSGARHAAGAWAFARFWGGLADPALAAEMNVKGGWLPSSPAMAAAPAYRAYVRRYPQYAAFMKAVAGPAMQTHPPIPDNAYLFDALDRAETVATSGDATPARALRDAQRELDHERARLREIGDAR